MLHHTHLPQLRFSEDLDLTALSAISLEELATITVTSPKVEARGPFHFQHLGNCGDCPHGLKILGQLIKSACQYLRLYLG